MKNYTDLAPSLPWAISPSLRAAPIAVAVGDVDGDSRKELVVIDRAHGALSLLSGFAYADAAAGWAAHRETQVVNFFAQPVIGGPKQDSPPWRVGGGDQVWCADVDGDRSDEIVIFNPGDQWIGLLRWSGTTLHSVWQRTGEIPAAPGAAGWVIGAADRHLVADLDGDGRDEILVFNPESLWMGVLRWDGAQLVCAWSAQNEIRNDPTDSWTIASTDQQFAADLDGDGRDEVLVFNPLDQCVGVLRWSDAALRYVWMARGSIPNSGGTGAYPINGADQYHVADLDGNGKDELFVFNPHNNWTGSFAWSGSALQWLGGRADGVPASVGGGPSWNFGAADQHFVADLDGDGADEIFVFNPDDQYVGVFRGAGSTMECPWLTGGQVPDAGGGTGGWVIGAADQPFVAAVDGSGRDVLVVVNPGDQWAGTLAWDGARMQSTWRVSGAFPAWGLALVAGAPQTPFPYAQSPFVEAGMAAYQYVSGKLAATEDVRSLYPGWTGPEFASMQQALDALSNPGYDDAVWGGVVVALSQDFVYGYVSNALQPGCRGDIRFEYTNGAKTSADFLGYQLSAQALAAAAPPPAFAFAAPDPHARSGLFGDVARQIAAECACVGDVVQLVSVNMTSLVAALRDAQMGQLDTVVANITQTVPPATVSNTLWWLGQAADALLWGAASVVYGEEGVPEINVAISITASLVGSLLSASSGSSGTTPPPPVVMLTQCAAQLETAYESAITSNLNGLTTILQDPVKLPLVYGLVQMPWAWPTNFVAATFSTHAEDRYRLLFYQQLVPSTFQLMVWNEVSQSTPFYTENNLGTPLTDTINAPANSFTCVVAADGFNDIYMLYQGGDDPSQSSGFKYPGTAMTDDLFGSLGVSWSDLYTGSNGWDLSQVPADAG